MTPAPLLQPRDLRCSGCVAPLAVEAVHPALSWRYTVPVPPSAEARQIACQILVASTPDRLQVGKADLWDSGRLETANQAEIGYTGRALAAGERAWWTVRAWDAAGGVSDFAAATYWEGGLDATDWAPATWIAPDFDRWPEPWPAPHLRHTFTLPAAPVRARAYICGLGYHEFYVNGAKCGDAVLEPGQTDYDLYALYVAHDITDHLHPGANVVGCILGEGWYHQMVVWKGYWEPYGRPGLIARIVVTCADGSTHAIATNRDWQAAAGPIRASNVYAGEVYDAREELGAWAEPGDPVRSDWHQVREVPPLSPALRPQLMPPIRRTQALPTVARKQVVPGTWVYDLGQNFAGWARLKLTAPRGTEVWLRFAEDVFGDGSLNPLSTGVVHTNVVQTDRYICRGGGEESWEPRFTYHGFRYVEVTGFPGEPPLDLLTGIAVHTDFAAAGTFACSDPLLNRIHDTAKWTLRSNLHSVPTDCPARERCGWLGDAHTITEATLLNFDAATFWQKYHRDILNTRGRCGEGSDPRVPANIAPGQRHCGRARPDWAVALVLIPWQVHLSTGTLAPLREAWTDMVAFTGWLEEISRDDLVEDGYGDWCPPGRLEPVECPPALTSSAYYFRVLTIMAESARRLDRAAEAATYAARAETVRTAFLARFYQKRGGTFGSQTADAFALALSIVPAELQPRVGRALARHVAVRHRGHFNAGIHGLRWLFDMLCASGHDATAWQALQVEGFPGFRQHFSQGATTFWEIFYEPHMHLLHDRSLNHPMQAAFDAWFFQGVAGIRADPGVPGYGHLLMTPHLWRQLDWAEATYESARGPIRSRWERRGREFTWEISLPANVTATVRVPEGSGFAEHALVPGSHVLRSRVATRRRKA